MRFRSEVLERKFAGKGLEREFAGRLRADLSGNGLGYLLFRNLFDLTYSRYMRMGLDASRTIGLGCDTCTLAYKKGGQTRIPDTLTDLMPGDADSP